MAMQATQKRVEEIEQQLLDLTAQLKELKASLPPNSRNLPPPPASYRYVVKSQNADNKLTTETTKAEHKTKKTATNSMNAKPRMIYNHKSKWKVMAIEYCAKTKMPKPEEMVAESEEWRFCWNYLSAKGCDREQCDWTHPKLTQEQQKNLSIRRKEVMKNRYRATLTFLDQKVFGEGDSKRNAIYAAYQQLFVLKLIDLDSANMSKYPLANQGVFVKNPKCKLWEFAQRRNLQKPSVTFCRDVNVYDEEVWKAKVVFGGKIVEMTDARKKDAEKKCCRKLMEIFDPHNL